MKNNLTYILTLLCASVCATVHGAPATVANYTFETQTPIAEGHWVKVPVSENGIYEITYDQLRQMGFADPSKVAVFGNKGSARTINFSNSRGTKLFDDVPRAIPVRHSDGKVFFYGLGAYSITPSYYSGTMRHRRDSNNPYSDVNWYLLTDSQPVVTVRSSDFSESDRKSATDAGGYAYHYYEKDIFPVGEHKLASTVYLGEQIPAGTSGDWILPGQVVWEGSLEYDVALPNCREGDAVITTQFGYPTGQGATIYSSLNGVTKTFSFNKSDTSALKILDNNASGLRLDVDPATGTGTGKVGLLLGGDVDFMKPVYLDYWVMTYPVDLTHASGNPDFSQQYMAFGGTGGKAIRHKIPENAVAWDISNPLSPSSLYTSDGYFYDKSNAVMETVVFDPAKTQKQVGRWKPVSVRNLHALQGEKYDFVIFTTELYRPYAETIAALHAEHDGIRTLVVTPQEVFDEFTNGMPDPMACRALVKMLWQAEGHPLKNVLFVGPIYSDYRNIMGISGRQEGHIAYEQGSFDISKDSDFIMDFYGCVTDTIIWVDNLSNVPIEIGVGILPFTSVEEADNTVAKIREYLETEDFSDVVNEALTMSYPGDNHLHDTQSYGMAAAMQTDQKQLFGSRLVMSQIWMEGIGQDNAVSAAFDAWNSGKLLSIYFGHAEVQGLGQGTNWPVSSSQMMNMTNDKLGFFFIAGCASSVIDCGQKGIGDAGVLRSHRGFIGSICASRSARTNYNETLAKNFFHALVTDRGGRVRSEHATVGEAYAIAKDKSDDTSEIIFQLVGDPALRVPVSLGKVNVETDRSGYRAGEVMVVSGSVLDADNDVDRNFDGFVTVKLNEPERTYLLGDTLAINAVNDVRLAAVKGRVEKGRFSVRLPLPESCDGFLGTDTMISQLPVYVGVYSPGLRKGASGIAFADMATRGSEPDPSAEHDTTPPAVTLSHDEQSRVIRVSASDDTSLRGSAVSLLIDGTEYAVRPATPSDIGTTYFEGTVSSAALGAGNHTAVLTAVDEAGNASERLTVQFRVPESAGIVLTAQSASAVGEMMFTISGGGGEDLELIVTDREGNAVATCTADGRSVSCDVSELPVGTYRAAVRHASAAGAWIYSNRVEFSKID